MIGRILRSIDFERVLRSPIRARSAFFAVHHLAERPSRPRPVRVPFAVELSTDDAPALSKPVDELSAEKPGLDSLTPRSVWLGAVVPKRHARRSVTRSLLKREIRSAMVACCDALKPGLWVVRLRAPIDRTRFPSATSEHLRQAVRSELLSVLTGAAGRA